MIRRHPQSSARARPHAGRGQKHSGRGSNGRKNPRKAVAIPSRESASSPIFRLPCWLDARCQITGQGLNEGFDWNDARLVIEKIREETDEIEAALDTGDSAASRGKSAISCLAPQISPACKSRSGALSARQRQVRTAFPLHRGDVGARWLGAWHCRIGGDGSALEYRKSQEENQANRKVFGQPFPHTTEAAFAKAVKSRPGGSKHTLLTRTLWRRRETSVAGLSAFRRTRTAHERCRPTPYFCA